MNTAATAADRQSEDIVHQYGYQQEFQRGLQRFASFAVAFSFISITTGIFTTYGSVLNWGGPRLPRTSHFNLGAFECPVVALALLWLLFELSIFRDAQFSEPWKYAAVMFVIGLIYFVWMLVREPESLQMPARDGEGVAATATNARSGG